VGIGYYLEELHQQNLIWPKVLVWWHDSYFERDIFSHPNPIIRKYLQYLPGTLIDGIVFINSTQPSLARKVYAQYGIHQGNGFFENRTVIIPNTHDITWNWRDCNWEGQERVFPPQDNYNNSLLHDLGIEDILKSYNFELKDMVILLQHTRIVPRKKIEQAIDLAFDLEKRTWEAGLNKCIILLISGHSGDEQAKYKEFLAEYFQIKKESEPGSRVFMIFGEHQILSHRDIIVDKKYYNFFEIPSVIAAYGGIGTYFSEVEGFGNNLLEMLAAGLPVLINRYGVFKTDLEPLGFDLPGVEDNILEPGLVETTYRLVTDIRYRNRMVYHNLTILSEKLGHRIIADSLAPLINHIFTRDIR
jgi:glycosyltransferase involved in cell wall biosynthesis